VEGDYAYLADDYYLEIFDCSQTYASQRKTNSFSYDEVSPADVFTLKSISPNPFNSTTTISFNLTQQLATKLTVFNQIGQEIAVLSEGILNAGEHKVAWNAEDYATGLYFVEISTPVGKELRKIILMK
jgi:predicted 3-demethylubiquinone-9 3-methyltransferase (glyoxalase superfamily)